MLHLVFELSLPTLERLKNQASVIFLNNAVLGLIQHSQWQNALIELMRETPCYVLSTDLMLRGIETNLLCEGIMLIDYAQFVQLTVEHTPIQTWN